MGRQPEKIWKCPLCGHEHPYEFGIGEVMPCTNCGWGADYCTEVVGKDKQGNDIIPYEHGRVGWNSRKSPKVIPSTIRFKL